MSEWEDDFWDYTQGADYQDYDREDREDDDPGNEEQEQEDEGSFDEKGDEDLGGGGDDQDLEFDQDFRQIQQSGYEKKSGTGGLSEGKIKSQRTPEEAASEQMQGILASSYSHLTEPRKQKVIATIEGVKNFFNMNIEVLILAALWIAENKKMERGEFQNWIKNQEYAKDISPMDLLRYIRVITVK